MKNNIDIIDVYRSILYELIGLTFKLPSEHLLVVYGIYHPPKPNYQTMDFLQYLVHLMESALDQYPDMTIVSGGGTNHLDINELG